jgi:endoglucanase
MQFLSVTGNQIVDANGARVRLRGTCPGGWMNMEDFINGYPGARSFLQRE